MIVVRSARKWSRTGAVVKARLSFSKEVSAAVVRANWCTVFLVSASSGAISLEKERMNYR
jgi:hypothetical protein